MAGSHVPPVASDLVDEVERGSRVFFSLMVRAMDGLGTAVSPAGLHALLVLEEVGTCSLGELADLLPLSQSATSRMVDRMVAMGLLDRRAAAEDRRQLRLARTAAGRRLTRELVRLRRQAIQQAMRTMAPKDLEVLRQGIHAFSANASAPRTGWSG